MGKWEMVRLADVFNLQMGKTPRRDNPKYWDNGSNKWISIADIGRVDKYISDTKERITQIAVNETGMRIVPQDTVIMSFKLSLGKTAITLESMYTNEAIMAFLDKEKYQVDIDYIYHLFCCFNWGESTNKAVMGVTLNKATLSNIKIPIPPLDEQKRIAKNLDLASEIVKGYKEQLAELDKLAQSVFYEMFGDPVTNSKKLRIKQGKDFFKLSSGKPVLPEKRFETGIPAYGGNGISWYTDNILFKQDTLIVGRVGFQSGNVRLAKGPMWITDNAMYMSEYQSSEYNLVFLCAVMKLINFTRFQDAGDLKKITQKPFMQMGFVSPPLPSQTRFASIVTEIETQKAQVQQALTEAENLFNSLMQEYYE